VNALSSFLLNLTNSKLKIGILFVLAAVALALPAFSGNGYDLYLATIALIWLVLAMALQLIFGYGGLLSVAHGGLFGVAAYATSLLNTEHGMTVLVSALLAILVTTVVAAVIGFICVRATGMAFAVLTLAFGVILYELMLNLTEVTNGPLGVSGIEPLPDFGEALGLGVDPEIGIYLTVVVVSMAALGALWWLMRSEFGRALICTREDETLAASYGINVQQVRRWAFTISGTFAALAGVMFAHYFQFIAPESFTFMAAFQAIVMVVAGGAGLILGTVVGAISLSLLPELLRDVSQYQQVAYGLILFLAIRFLPKGVVGSIRDWAFDRKLERRRKSG
jgi:branched-chain amino acid transport system permease protein